MKKNKANGVELNFSTFQPKHLQLMQWAADPTIRSILAAGGVRSGKTIALTTIMFMRALRAPGSTHGFFHATRDSCKRNLFETTFPETLEILLPGWWSSLKADPAHYVDLSDLQITLPNGSKFIFMGLDKADKVRGLKFSTIMLNEANFVDYKTVMTLRGRLSEEIKTIDGVKLETKMLFDLNPTFKSSWDYQLFVEQVVPGDRRPLTNPSTYRYLTINAIDNKPNLPASLFEEFEDMTEEQRRRDEFGMWSEDNPSALFDPKTIGRRHATPDDMEVMVVAIDPAGTSRKQSDHTGMIVAGKGFDGQYYVFEDATIKAKPNVWIMHSDKLREDYDCRWIISEKDYAQDILVDLISRTIPSAPVRYVSSRGLGKRLRAEPIAAMYERGLVNHVPNYINPRMFHALEQQMVEFDAPSFKGSPDRVDALVYALQFLSEQQSAPSPVHHYPTTGLWL